MTARNTKKAEALTKWRNLPERQDPLAVMQPIPYKAEGSSYGACGIRVDGTPEFVDAVLSNLKGLLDGENQVTRLELARHEIDHDFKPGLTKACDGAEVCYVRLHVRGHEGAIAATFFDKHPRPATERFAAAQGLNPDA